MKYVLCLLIGYVTGTINPSYIIARLRGFDIREKGSGNAGASNALILFGKVLGIGCALFDIAKAAFAIWLCGRLFPGLAYSLAITGVACILGHVFPFYMKFKGGKGL
ncbi:MAG: glycerol-3-phosphate acyltransferase, partial [Clostridia bacterium]|nr:glycerol-3-phosphate acyltransferase [Clostridia bacterium]